MTDFARSGYLRLATTAMVSSIKTSSFLDLHACFCLHFTSNWTKFDPQNLYLLRLVLLFLAENMVCPKNPQDPSHSPTKIGRLGHGVDFPPCHLFQDLTGKFEGKTLPLALVTSEEAAMAVGTSMGRMDLKMYHVCILYTYLYSYLVLWDWKYQHQTQKKQFATWCRKNHTGVIFTVRDNSDIRKSEQKFDSVRERSGVGKKLRSTHTRPGVVFKWEMEQFQLWCWYFHSQEVPATII